jgi:hypothetical protein
LSSVVAERWPVLALFLGETDLARAGNTVSSFAGHFVASNFFQSIENNENNAWFSQMHDYAAISVVDARMQNVHNALQFWSTGIIPTNQSIYLPLIELISPEGAVQMGSNRHLSHPFRIAQIGSLGALTIILDSTASRSSEPWSRWLINEGLSQFECDHSPGGMGSKFAKPFIPVALLFSYTGPDAR